ncbi:glycosyltransferase [Alteromonas stellipolaris]|uniref:glycosyltransferase n=1 Tax=Alteromonas stellipolaris TaxID=233316 RepID=UPI00249424D8|nr:glycosyltransferase family 2 protein [Alteromonas stellipolaris]
MPLISVVICTYNRYDVLKKAIDSLTKQSLDDEKFEILVIDNTPNAEGGKGALAKKEFESIKNLTYVFEKTPGLSNARNVGYKLARSNYISYLDDDAIASSEWVEEVLKAFEGFENVGVVGGRIAPIWEIPRPSWLGDALVGNVSVVDWGGELRVAGDEEWFAGANISFSKQVLEEAGGFSTNLGRKGGGQVLLSNEESEVLNFVKQSEYIEVYNPKASVDHLVEKKRLTRDWFRRRSAWQAASDFMMNAVEAEKNLPDQLTNIKDYLCSLPPRYRNIQGLYYATDEAGEFQWQLSAIYANTILTLAGFDGLEGIEDGKE